MYKIAIAIVVVLVMWQTCAKCAPLPPEQRAFQVDKLERLRIQDMAQITRTAYPDDIKVLLIEVSLIDMYIETLKVYPLTPSSELSLRRLAVELEFKVDEAQQALYKYHRNQS